MNILNNRDDDDDDDDDQDYKQQSIMNFIKQKQQNGEGKLKVLKSSNFFIEQDIEQINDLDRIFDC